MPSIRPAPGRAGHGATLCGAAASAALCIGIGLASGAAAGRQNLVTEILHELGGNGKAQEPPHDLRDLHTFIMAAPAPVRLLLQRFDIMKSRWKNYKEDFFSALKYLVERRKLTLIIE